MAQITPELALALRLRQLSTIVIGNPVARTNQNAPSLASRLERFLHEYTQLVGTSEAVKRFVTNCPFDNMNAEKLKYMK